jgi:parallel beta-helix repeat protein
MLKKKIYLSLRLLMVGVLLYITGVQPQPVTARANHNDQSAEMAGAAQIDILTAGTYDDSHAAMQYTNGWKSKAQSSALNGAHRMTKLANKKIRFTFYGGQFDLMYTKTSSSGRFSVTIDGVKYSFNSSQATTQYQARWLSPSLVVGQHTVVIKKQRDDGKPIFVDGVIIYAPPASPTNTATAPQTGLIYYVSTTGSDSANGSQSAPWRTIQKAANTIPANSTIVVLQGNYPERVTVNRSGQDDAPIVFQAQGRVVMRGFTVTSNYVAIRGFEITDTPNVSTDGWGIWVSGDYCLIENNYVHYATRGGIVLFYIPGQQAANDCIVRNNRLYRNALTGIEIHGQNNLVEGNEIWGTIQHHPKWTSPPNWVDADGIRFHGSGHIFRNNYIHDILYGIPENINPHIDCFQTFTDGNYKQPASNILFEKNTCVNMQAQSSQEVGKAFMIENASGLTIRNNILRAYRVIQGINSNNLIVVNNVLTNRLDIPTSSHPSIISLTNTPNSFIKNNIFFDPLQHVIYFADSASQQGINISHNNIYRSNGTNVTGTAYPNDLWNVNPMFVNPAEGSFRLQAVSPLINKGITLSMVKVDFDGKARPQGSAYDIGAYEWSP